MASVERLKKRLALTLKAKKIDAALEAIAALAEIECDDPVWPQRAARLLHARKDVAGELTALRRALELQIDRGTVVDAISSCKAILAIDPEDDLSRDCLDRLYLSRRIEEETPGVDEPLESLVLAKHIPGARSVAYAEEEPGLITEIPIDVQSSGGESAVDLRLDEWASKGDLGDLAAAQAASLPTGDELARGPFSDAAGSRSLRSELANVPLFGDLDPSSLHTLIRRVRVVRIKGGQVLFRQGDPANSLYVVVEGAVVPIAEGKRRRKLAVLERGEFFGEIGLLTKQPRNATIEGLVDSQLLAIDRRVLWELIERQPSVAKNILRFLRARLIDRQIRTNLFFAAFAHGERSVVARQFRMLEVSDGARIIEQGKPPEGLFVVLSGRLERIDTENEKSLGEVGIGDVLGGLSLIEGRVADSDVVARGKCWIVVLGEARFRRIVDANPRLIRVLRRLAAIGDLPTLAAL